MSNQQAGPPEPPPPTAEMTDLLGGLADRISNTFNPHFATSILNDLQHESGLGAAIAVLSMFLLSCASLILVWHVIAGIVASAYEGKVLGQRWHQIWAPVRVTLGIGLLVPLSALGQGGQGQGQDYVGWNTAQLAALNLMHLSDTIATKSWVAFSDQIFKEGKRVLTPPPVYVDAELFTVVATAEVCRALDEGQRRMWHENDILAPIPEKTLSPHPYGLVPSRDDLARHGMNDDPTKVHWWWGEMCGGFSFTYDQNNSFHRARRQAVANLIRDIRSGAGLEQPIGDYLFDAYHAPVSVTIPKEEVQQQIEEFYLQLVSMRERYKSTLETGIAARLKEIQQSDSKRTIDAATERYGWLAAGMVWTPLRVASTDVASAASESPEIIKPQVIQGGGAHPSYAFNAQGTLEAFREALDRTTSMGPLRAYDTSARFAQSNRLEEPQSRLVAEVQEKVNDFFSEKLRMWQEWILNGIIKLDPIDPMGTLIGRGALFAGVLDSLPLLAIGLGIITGNGISAALGGLGVLITTSPILFVMFLIIAVFAVVFGYILPMIPFIFMISIALGWIVTLIEVLIALPILAFLMVRMDGQDFIDSVQRPGFVLASMLLLRPILTTLGMCAAFWLVPQFLSFASETFGFAFFTAIEGKEYRGLWSPIFIGGIMAMFIYYHIIIQSFKLATSLPDRIFKWIGSPGDSYGEVDGGDRATALLTQQGSGRAEALGKGGPRGAPKGGPTGGPQAASGMAKNPAASAGAMARKAVTKGV